jgi:hypothetical protein
MLAQAFMESCVVFDNSAYGITCTAEAEPVKSESSGTAAERRQLLSLRCRCVVSFPCGCCSW